MVTVAKAGRVLQIVLWGVPLLPEIWSSPWSRDLSPCGESEQNRNIQVFVKWPGGHAIRRNAVTPAKYSRESTKHCVLDFSNLWQPLG